MSQDQHITELLCRIQVLEKNLQSSSRCSVKMYRSLGERIDNIEQFINLRYSSEEPLSEREKDLMEGQFQLFKED